MSLNNYLLPGSITKAEIIEYATNTSGLDKEKVGKIVEKFFAEVAFSLVQETSVRLSGFGSFNLIDRKARVGRNPKTKEPALITARKIVKFKVSKRLKGRLGDQR
jgi:integration host factor subunit alpha